MSESWRWINTSVNNVYVTNAIGLAPIFIYTIVNHIIINKANTPRKTRIHLQHFLYFVDLPLCASIVAFGLLACCVIDWETSTNNQESVFVDGAAALIIFLASSMTICVDEHANASLYRAPEKPDGRWWWSYMVGIVSMVVVGGIVFGRLLLGHGLLLIGTLQCFHALFVTRAKFYASTMVGVFYGLAGFVILVILKVTEGAATLRTDLAAVIIVAGLIVSSLLRLYAAYHYRERLAWLPPMVAGVRGVLVGYLHLLPTISGVFGVIGTLILTGMWEYTVFWYLLVLDVLTHGTWWLFLSRKKQISWKYRPAENH